MIYIIDVTQNINSSSKRKNKIFLNLKMHKYEQIYKYKTINISNNYLLRNIFTNFGFLLFSSFLILLSNNIFIISIFNIRLKICHRGKNSKIEKI
jgi:hypothetical protein